jgi:hypothetical protein
VEYIKQIVLSSLLLVFKRFVADGGVVLSASPSSSSKSSKKSKKQNGTDEKSMADDEPSSLTLQVSEIDFPAVVSCIQLASSSSAEETTTHSSQTRHHALLLLSLLGSLAPEQVVDKLLPVFESLGSSLLKDDSYTFAIIQQTIESVLPAVLSHQQQEQKKHKKSDNDELVVPLLKIFVDAARSPSCPSLPFFSRLLYFSPSSVTYASLLFFFFFFFFFFSAACPRISAFACLLFC